MSETFADVVAETRELVHNNPAARRLPKGQYMVDWLDRLQAAHDDDVKMAYERGKRKTELGYERYNQVDTMRKREYHRGYDDGRHSMDAEHRTIAMKLRGLRLDGGSHENLSKVAYAVYPCATGWTRESVDGLRDRLIDLIGGVSDGATEPMTTDELIEYINQDTRRLKGDATKAGDGNDTCACAGGGACDADCGRDSGEQEEVEHGGTSDDCADGFRGGSGSDVVHLAGVTYDTLSNERRKAVCELRKLPDWYPHDGKGSPAGKFNEVLSDAIGVMGLPSFAKIRDRIIHLLGGDGPSEPLIETLVKNTEELSKQGKVKFPPNEDGSIDSLKSVEEADTLIGDVRRRADQCDDFGSTAIDEGTIWDTCDRMWREGLAEARAEIEAEKQSHNVENDDECNFSTPENDMDTEDQPTLSDLWGIWKNWPMGHPNGTCPNDDTTSSITDELRKYVAAIWDGSMYVNQVPMELLAIADRIDEQFDRICQQQEAVLQETIDEMVDERDHWKELSDMYSNMLLRISSKNVSLKAECDELRDEDVKIKRQYAKLCVERADLLDLLRDARDEYKLLDQMLAETSANFHAMRDRVWSAEAERDELQAECDGLTAALDELHADPANDMICRLERERDELQTRLEDVMCERDFLHEGWTERGRRLVDVEGECDELQAKLEKTTELLEVSYGKQRIYKTHIAQMDGGSKRLREEVKSLKRAAERDADQIEALSATVDDMTMEREDIGKELRKCVEMASKSYDNTAWHEMDGNEDEHTWCSITVAELLSIAKRIEGNPNK